MSHRVLGTNVLVRRTEICTTTEGGIELPDNAQVKQPEGTILAIGPELLGKEYKDDIKKLVPAPHLDDIRVGDEVIFQQHAVTEILLDDEILLVMDLDDILVVKGKGK